MKKAMKAMKAMKKAMKKKAAAAPAPKAMKAMKKKAAAPAPKAMKAMKKAMKAMKAMKKAMKAMKAMKAGGAMSQTAAYQSVAKTTGLKTKDAKGVVEALMAVAVSQVKKSGSFKLAGMLNMKLKNKPATKARKGVNPFTKEPCVFKAKPASKTVRCLAMKKLKEML